MTKCDVEGGSNKTKESVTSFMDGPKNNHYESVFLMSVLKKNIIKAVSKEDKISSFPKTSDE